MCTVCGCSAGQTLQRDDHAHSHGHEQDHPANQAHSHLPGNRTIHDHSHGDHASHTPDYLHYGMGPAHAHASGMSQERMIRIEQEILGKNNRYAQENRDYFSLHGILALNLVSSPGSGKTTLLVNTIRMLAPGIAISVIEGDQQTSRDADRIRSTGAPAIQINTGKGCHLDACMVGEAVTQLSLPDNSMLMIENVGNLVCPAAFDLGEAHKVVILSVTEGEEKPLKYPDMFYASDLMILNKTDLLPYLDFNTEKCISYARQINPDLQVLRLSATTGEGMQNWTDWLAGRLSAIRQSPRTGPG